jgi:hypothetical protein
VMWHKMKIGIQSSLLFMFIFGRLLSVHKFDVIRICPLLKFEYLFSVWGDRNQKLSMGRVAVLLF